jgi:hypothetical protein
MTRLLLPIAFSAVSFWTPVAAQTATATKLVGYRNGKELLRKINGRWWTKDNREVYPSSKTGVFWEIDSEVGVVDFYHHRPFDLAKRRRESKSAHRARRSWPPWESRARAIPWREATECGKPSAIIVRMASCLRSGWWTGRSRRSAQRVKHRLGSIRHNNQKRSTHEGSYLWSAGGLYRAGAE